MQLLRSYWSLPMLGNAQKLEQHRCKVGFSQPSRSRNMKGVEAALKRRGVRNLPAVSLVGSEVVPTV